MRAFLLSCTLATGALAPLGAQELADLCHQYRTFKNGQWASYRLESEHADTATMRFAIVGVEGAGDAARYLYEIATNRQRKGKTETTILQMQVSGLGTSATHIYSFVMKAGDRPAMKYPEMMVGMANQAVSQGVTNQIAKNCATAQTVGWESVTVPAGTFRALHIRTEDGGDAWIAREIPFGMVQVKSTNGHVMVLTGRGADAKTAITEVPQDMMGGRH